VGRVSSISFLLPNVTGSDLRRIPDPDFVSQRLQQLD
jgi:hypothetical protein